MLLIVCEELVTQSLLAKMYCNILVHKNSAAVVKRVVLIALVDDLHLSIDKGCASLFFLLDLFSAFDIVYHAILLTHLEAEVGIRR